MAITTFVQKYIDLMSFDKPRNSLPFMIFIAIGVFVQTNIMFALRIVVTENLEKTLQTLTDCSILIMMISNLIKRSLNNEEVTKLLDLIESDLEFGRYELTGRKDDLWRRIQTYWQKKKKDMGTMSRNVKAIFYVCAFVVTNRNALIYLSGLTNTDSESASINWPTPIISYCPPELKSPVFFIYFYFLFGLTIAVCFLEGFLIIFLVCLSTERLLADFDILIIFLDDIVRVFSEPDPNSHSNNRSQAIINLQNNHYHCKEQTVNLKKDINRIVHHHQTLTRNFNVCAHGSYMISMMNMAILVQCCTTAYLTLTTDDLKKRMNFALSFILVSLTTFFAYHNGQRILNQNDILRRKLAELPWTDKPQWFKQTIHVMMTRANVDIEMRPFGIYTLNYVSFKDLMKTTYSIGNILYRKSHIQQ